VNTAKKGRRKEHQVRDLFRNCGYLVVRAAGSLGPVDLVCIPQTCRAHGVIACAGAVCVEIRRPMETGSPGSATQVVLVQVKPRTIYRAERAALEALSRTTPLHSCRIEGWVVVDRKKPYRQFFY
jgi:hypothetical protein